MTTALLKCIWPILSGFAAVLYWLVIDNNSAALMAMCWCLTEIQRSCKR